MSGFIKRVVSILILLITLSLSGVVIYRNGMGIEEFVSRIDDVPIYNQLYMLSEGIIMEQIFTTDNDYLAGVDLMVVNIPEGSTGELVVQLVDMWGDVVKEARTDFASIPVGEYCRFTFDAELDQENNEEFQLRVYAENASIAPALVCVYETQDVEENSLCYYAGDLIESRLVVGYAFGRPRYVGYESWERAKIQSAAAGVILLILTAAVLIYCIHTVRWSKVKDKITNISILYQLTILAGIFSAFFLSAVINKLNTNVKIPAGVYAWLIGTVLLLSATCFLWLRSLEKNRGQVKAKTELADPFAWVIVLFLIITRLPMFTQIQKWDGSAYYGVLNIACKNFDFTFESVWTYFRLASHPSFLYTFFCAIGEFLIPDKVTGVLIVQLVLTIAAMICIYQMLRNYWCHMKRIHAMLAVLLLSVNPLFWGTFSIVNIDYFLLVFFVFLVYSDYRKLDLLRFFWMGAVMLTKETGWVIVAGYLFVNLVRVWRGRRGREESLKAKFRRLSKEPVIRIGVLLAVLLCFYAVRQGSLFGWLGTGVDQSLFASSEKIRERGLGVNSVGIYLPYIFHKLAQMFLLNFMWIPTGLIAASCVFIFRQKKRYRKKIRNLEGSVGALVFFILFNIFFVTAALSRYTIFSTVVIWLLGIILSYYAVLPRIRPGVLAGSGLVVVLLLCIQNFAYIDPVSNLIFTRLDSGRGTILSTDMELNSYGDTLINNYRFSSVDKLLDKMLKTVEYDQDMQIIALGEKDTYSIAGISGMYDLGWDVEKKKRISANADAGERTIIPVSVLSMADLEATQGQAAGPKAVVYFLKYCEYDEESYLERLREYYEIGERREIKNWGGTLACYVLEKRA